MHGTLRSRTVMGVTVLALVAAAGCDGGGDIEGAAGTPSPTTATEVAADADAAAAAFQAAYESFETDWFDAEIARDDAAAQNDLEAAIAASADIRNAVFAFDAEVREIAFPDEVVPSVNEFLTANAALIAVLDQYAGVAEIPEYNGVLDVEQAAQEDWWDALEALATELDVDLVPEVAESTPEEEGPAADEEVPAGTTYDLTAMTGVVPEGFVGMGTTGMMEGPDGVRVSSGKIFDYEGSLDEVADEYVGNVADKNGYEIQGSPVEVTVGNGEGRLYELTLEGELTLQVVFEQEAEFYSISLRGTPTAVEDSRQTFVDMLETVEGTF